MNTKIARWAEQKSAGFSYAEVLVASFLIAITLTPAMESLRGGIQGSSIHSSRAIQHYQLITKVEEVLAKSFTELEQEADTAGGPTAVVSAYSDGVGSENRRLVYIARFDGDNADGDNDGFTGVDADLLWLKVETEGRFDAFETLSKK